MKFELDQPILEELTLGNPCGPPLQFFSEKVFCNFYFVILAQELEHGHFSDVSEVVKWLTEFFKRQPATFWYKGIHALPGKWEQVMLNNGEYIS